MEEVTLVVAAVTSVGSMQMGIWAASKGPYGGVAPESV